MSQISCIKADATQRQADGRRILLLICNDIGGWGRGFVFAISNRWKEPEAEYRKWYAGRDQNDFALGNVQFIPVKDTLLVSYSPTT